QLSKSRRELATRLYSVWSHYLEHVSRLADYFIRVIVNSTFRSEAPPSVIEKELRDLFCEMVTVWAPLLEPVNTGLAPWNPADTEHARLVVERLIQLLMWLPHCMYLPPGSETVESLMWQYFSTKLITLQRAGTAHVFEVYDVKMVGLNWTRFWPTLLDLGAMEHMLVEGPPEAIPLLTEILVRIPWLQVIQHQHGQPEDAHKAFHSLLLSIIARCVHRQANYAKSRVSVEKLVKSLLAQCQWFYVKAEAVEKTGAFVSSAFPSDALTSPNDILKAFFNIWRQTCFFSSTPPAVPPTVTSDLEIPRKQSLYVRTDLRLLLKSGIERTEQAKHYKELIAKCNLILGSADKSQYLCLAKELIAFWTEITKEKHTELFVQTLCDWLNEHAESPMLLLVLNTAMDALGNTAPQIGLRLLDKSIQAYFTRRLSCEWAEVCQWFNLPERAKEWLYSTPSSDSGVEPRYLVLNAQLMLEMARLQSVQDETHLMKRLADYIQSIKPKYVTSEPAFLLCVEKWQRMLLRQYSNGVSPTVANENLEVYLAWLRKVHSEEKSGVSFFSMVTKFGRKPTYPVKIQLLTNLLSLYITQQQTSAAQPPRMQGSQAVFQSRIQAFRDLQQAKQYQELGASVFPVAGPFFTQIDAHCFPQTTQLFSRCAQLLYPDEKILQKLDL
ncbi:Protein C56C10.11, partial [Aphelenchoides avenae]